MNTKSVGEKSEGMVLARFLQKGWVVLTPFGDNQRYDLVIDRGNGFERVQVKTGSIENGCVIFNACSSTAHRKNGGRRDYRGQADFFASYCPTNEKIYLIGVSKVGRKQVSLRIDPPKNKQTHSIMWAKDFEI